MSAAPPCFSPRRREGAKNRRDVSQLTEDDRNAGTEDRGSDILDFVFPRFLRLPRLPAFAARLELSGAGCRGQAVFGADGEPGDCSLQRAGEYCEQDGQLPGAGLSARKTPGHTFPRRPHGRHRRSCLEVRFLRDRNRLVPCAQRKGGRIECRRRGGSRGNNRFCRCPSAAGPQRLAGTGCEFS